MATSELKVAIVHDWLTNYAGAERVVSAMLEAFPQAELYTSVYNQDMVPQFARHKPHTSFLQSWPLARTRHQLYPAMRQLAFEQFDFSDYDVVISSSTAEAKGIITPSETLHISYINTPTRYYWIDYKGYLANPGFGPLNPIVKRILPHWIATLKRWDYAAAQRPDFILANSNNVAERIERYYDRKSTVMYPPVDVERFVTGGEGAYYLVVSRLVPYKRVDIAVDAFTQSGLPLMVVGEGSQLSDLQSRAGNNISFVTNASDAQVVKYMQECKAFIFCGDEDFGIAPVEAMAAGKPVVAYKKGGILETVVEGETGIFFDKLTVDSLNSAISLLQKQHFSVETIRKNAERFRKEQFIDALQTFVTKAHKKHMRGV